MILETLAWIFDATLYRIDRIPDESYINFFRLIAGARGEETKLLVETLKKDPNSDRHQIEILEFLRQIEERKSKRTGKQFIIEMKAAALRFIYSKYRAITEEDFKFLAIEATQDRKDNDPKVKRVEIQGYPDGRILMIIISDRTDKYDYLKQIVSEYLEPRRLIGTKIIVKEPVYSPLDVLIEVAAISPAKTSNKIKKTIWEFLDPIKGGDDGKGWVYGRPLTVFELYHKIEETEGVHHAISVVMDNDPGLKVKKINGLIHPLNITVNVRDDK